MNKQITPRKNRGLTVAELMISMTILFIVSTFVMEMFLMGARQTADAGQNQDLDSLTRNKLSELAVLPYPSLAPLGGTSTAFGAPYGDYTYSIDFEAVAGEAMSDARVVVVTVSHAAHGNRTGKIVRSNVPPIDPGQRAWNKFGCASCHDIPSAGYSNGYTPNLENIGADGLPRAPLTALGAEDYIKESVKTPTAFDAFSTTEGTMTNYITEDEGTFDPAVSGNISDQELDDMAAWVATFQ